MFYVYDMFDVSNSQILKCCLLSWTYMHVKTGVWKQWLMCCVTRWSSDGIFSISLRVVQLEKRTRNVATPMEITRSCCSLCAGISLLLLITCCWCGGAVGGAVVRCCWRSSDCGHEEQNTPTLVSTPAQAARARALHGVVTRGDQSRLGSWVMILWSNTVFRCIWLLVV